MIPGSGNPNNNNNMGMPGFGMPLPGTGIISAPPIITGSRMAMGMQNPMMGGMMPGGGLGMMPNPMMGGNQMPQGMFPGMMQSVQQPNMGMPMQTEQPVEVVEAALRKVFVKNIPEDVPDTFMESLLKECGNIAQWKRTKNEKDIPIPFGSCEFETVEGVLRCLRVMNNLKLLDNYLVIKPSENTEAFIGEWAEKKKKEWLATSKDKTGREEDFERYLQKDDAKALENIHTLIDNFDVNKVREDREREAEKKEHPKEKERDRRKRAQLKELEKNFKKELNKWLDYEEKIDRDQRKERERDRERDQEKERWKQRLLEKELRYDSEEERRRKIKSEQSKKARQRELEEDELERRKEMMEEEKKAQEESQMEIEPPPPENMIPIPPQEDDNPLTKPEQPRPRASKFSLITVEPSTQETAPPVEIQGLKPFQIEMNPQKGKGGAPVQTIFSQEQERQDNEDDQQLYSRKHKINVKIDKPTEITQNVVTFDPEKKQAVIKFNVSTPLTNTATSESQKVLQDLESLVRQIPRNKTDLFNYKINWTLLATSDLIEKKVKPWLCKQSVELLGQEEMDFVNVVLKKLANRESPQQILRKVEKLLDEEAEDFMMKLWRMLIFELLKLENNIE